nr:hypothetical protein [uncultured bacterium]
MSYPGHQPGVVALTGIPITPEWFVVGAHTYLVPPVRLAAWRPGERIVIGRYCSIATDLFIMTGGSRRTDLASTYPMDRDLTLHLPPPRPPHDRAERPGAGLEGAALGALARVVQRLTARELTGIYRSTADTTVGNDVWVGARATILGGARVGDGAVVAAGSVVLDDVPPYAVVAGNPARVVRYRFSRGVVERLLRIRWWDWPDERVREHRGWFSRPVAEFVARFDPQPAEAARP